MIEYDSFFKQLMDGYRSNFDVEILDEVKDGLVAKAHMHVTEYQCAIFEEFKMWTANADEYVYVFRIPHLDDATAERLINFVYEDGLPLIKLEHVSFRNQHMCTHLVALFLCDSAEEAAIKRIKKCNIYKSFQFSLKGWMEMHTNLLTIEDSKVFSNRYGKETAKFLKMHMDHYNKAHM